MDFLTDLGPGDRLGSYTLVRKLGEGGMGVVFEAQHATLRRPAAVKVLSAWLSTGLGRRRFEREVQACAALTHPNTIEIYDYGETEDGTLYYAMEFLEGYDLTRLVQLDGAQTAARTIRVLDPIAGALGEAHAHDLVHRDIKPPNIVLCEAGGVPDVAKLLDFGLVVPMKRGSTRLTMDGHVLGTPRYVPPEMIGERGEVSPASDLYSLGLVAYFLLSGRHAFDGDSSADILRKQRDEAPPPLREVAPDVPDDLAEVVHWCLAKDPTQRPRSARELRDALQGCAAATQWDAAEASAWWDRWRDQELAERAPTRPSITAPSTTAPSTPAAKKRER